MFKKEHICDVENTLVSPQAHASGPTHNSVADFQWITAAWQKLFLENDAGFRFWQKKKAKSVLKDNRERLNA